LEQASRRSISLVLADDHPIVLEGLVQLFRLERDFRVLARCTSGGEALVAVRRHRPDVLILDVRMPDKNGLAILREITGEQLRTRVVLLTAALTEDEVLESIRLGVWGLVLKEMAPQTLVECVRQVHAGDRWLDTRSVVRALEEISRRESGVGRLAALLTPRELDMVQMIANGLRNKEIAARLSISEGTVKIHLHNIYEKLQVDGRLALLLYAQEHGLV
jgi:DNA-binding NarL/FixJ family response regulator